MPNLYVTEQGAQIEKEAGQILVCKHGEVLVSLPATRIEHIVVVGMIGVTTPALAFLLERGIDLVLLNSNGTFRGRLSGDVSPHIELRHRQHQRVDDPGFRLAVGKSIVSGKIANQRALCLRWDERNDDVHTSTAVRELLHLRSMTACAQDSNELMGIEGQSSKIYFSVFRRSLAAEWAFKKRVRRPPPDPINALLSICYTLLHEQCRSALEAVSLDPYCGFLHAPRRGRCSLAVDLMEEFRSIIADSVVLSLTNNQRIHQSDFSIDTSGPRLNQDGWRAIANQFEQRMQTLITPTGQTRRVSYQKLIEVQARKLRHVIEGSSEYYEPFETR